MPLELNPNPNRSRTEIDLSRDVVNEATHTGLSSWVFPGGSTRSHLASLSPRERRARDRPGVATFAAGWGLDTGAKTGPEAANLAIWAGEAGRGPAHVEKIPCAKRRGRQLLGISVFQQAHPHNFKTGVS